MCGIAGIIGSTPSRVTVEAMTRTLRHRGPDDSGVWESDGACLGHTRLSILDLSSAGHQPMIKGHLAIVYNGEIYNFRELRRDLPGPFASETDTEVLLHLYERDGADMVQGLRGMFAFAIWDAHERRLFAARDRLGIKPFFYRETRGDLAFGSEIKALLELGRPDMDRTALRDFFSYKYVPHPKTIYAGIHRLPPAHTLSWTGGKLEIQRYWEPSAETRITEMSRATECLGELLTEIVPEHTLADVPVGLFLSGGIDSTTLAAHLDRPRSFTLAVDSARFNEAESARRVAEHYETEHVEEPAAAIDLSEAIRTIPGLYDEPFGDSAAWSAWLVSRMAARHVKVALTGEGGDELFLGYRYYDKFPTYRSTALRRVLSELVPPFSKVGRSLGRRAKKGLERYATFLPAFTVRQKHALLSPDLLEPGYDDLWHVRRFWREELDPLKRLQWADLHAHLPGGLLTKVDRASMAHSLEARPPLLDHRLVEFALSLDTRLLRDPAAGQGKLVVRALMEPRVPAGLFDQPKKGFGLPIREWVGREPDLLPRAFDRLTKAGILRGGSIPRLDNDQTWSLLVLDQWMEDAGFA
ncbi:MAG: asparagine synthase (glutamine-hydrolyzing) [Gemmatimonadetes bacterium]|nr:asparagine synthase (glutamine-hydrolyzing) [Gemmatimonadota bacterium]